MPRLVMDILESLLEQKHVFVDYNQAEIADITRAVHTLIRRLISRINSRNSRFLIVDMIPGGSMVEQTRVWPYQEFPMIEYDYLVLLQYRYEAQTIKHGCQGHLKIANHQFVKQKTGSYCLVEDIEEEFQTDDVLEEFNVAVMDALYDKCCLCQNRTRLTFNPDLFICENCSQLIEHTSTGSLQLVGIDMDTHGSIKPLLFKWKSNCLNRVKMSVHSDINKSCRQPNEIIILSDFVPGISFKRDKISEVFGCNYPFFPVDIETPNRFFLVPKSCGRKHLTCWRISYCTSEVEVIQKTQQKHIKAYRLIKFFKYLYFEKSVFSSYFMKSVVLSHINRCTNDGPLIQPCLIDMLVYILECLQQNNLPHVFLRHNLFEGIDMFPDKRKEQIFLMKFETLIGILKSNRYFVMLANCKDNDKLEKINAVLQEICRLLSDGSLPCCRKLSKYF